ncbi:P-loop NTPase fold protein [Dickeya solani]|uniref:P-loop NTPase fold protein n=1 Tax=Dickeya solani TaxID=1089444 RepID=A0ABU4EGM0_9GAMM|nr:P-loop NTPase fold protein [Dickeya solani]MCA6999322.1 hypothetical protein [Dickeya solani]MCZ0820504.1 hypothetical protein [Dickeya solani]MDV6996054.1 P-loop NTPase fold protein [Dickeya solani]MDV7005551.1 P-loop NTPase fold protein [Dickeya solani]MDV7037409.1 P-loop NTPase fold protein [Dickeya solani]
MSDENISEITIDLDNVFDLRKYNEETMLQYAAKVQLEQLLKGFVKSLEIYSEAKSCQPNSDELLNNIFRSNNTIFINGQRGTGKTTFLRAMLDYYSEGKNNSEGVCPLAFIDPTLIETHQNILIDIVVKFKQLYDSKLKYCADEERSQRLNKCLEEMAEGLKLASHHKTNHDKHDDGWFLNQALKSAKSGQYLEERLHHFINAIAEVLNKKLFIIAIDDVDTHTQKAYEVLETIRRYLNHPRVVVLISGDLRLYNHIVINQKQLELQSGGKQSNDEKEARDLVSHLTQQYMAKIFPAYQRIDLQLLLKLFENKNWKVLFSKNGKVYQGIENSEQSTGQKSPDLLSDIISLTLKIKDAQQKYYRDFILSQPIRTVVQLLKMMPINQDGKLIESPDLRDLVISALKRIFISEILEQSVDYSLLDGGDKALNKISCGIFILCHRHGELETGFYLRPDSDDEAYNAVKVYLAMVVSRLLEENTLSNAMTFMLTSAMPANIYMHYLAEKEKGASNLPRKYVEYLGLTRGENVTGVVAHCNPVIFHGYDNTLKQIHGGVIKVNRKISKSFDRNNFETITGGAEGNAISSLDQLSKKLDNDRLSYADVVSAVTILASASSVQEGAEKRDYISIFSLLAVMARLLDKNSDYSIERFISLQTFGYPAFLDRKKETRDEGSEDNGSDDDTQDLESNFIKTLNEKIRLWKNMSDVTCSSLLMGKAWERIQYTLLSASEDFSSKKFLYKEENKKEDILLGHLFSAFIFGVINAFFIEEVNYNQNIPEELVRRLTSAKNTVTSPKELTLNINRVIGFISSGKSGGKKFLDLLPMTSAIIRCPLILPFLLPDLNPSSFYNEIQEEKKIILWEIKGGGRTDREKLYQAILSTGLLNELYSIDERRNESDQKKSAPDKEDGMLSGDKYLYISRLPVSGCFTKK